MSVVSNLLRTVPWRSVRTPKGVMQPAHRLIQPAHLLIQPAHRLIQPAHLLIQQSWMSLGKSLFSTNSSPPVTKTATSEKNKVKVIFKRSSGQVIEVEAKVGDTLLDVVVNNNVDIDGFGACEGTLSCSTCHLILKQADFDKIKEKPTDEELDMLDLAYGLTDTSRLGCQIFLTPELNGLEVQIPEGINDVRIEPS